MSLESRKRSLRILAVVAGAAAAMACGGGGYSSSPTPMPTPTSTGGGSSSADVTITVAWRNADSIQHTATGAGFDTGALSPGQVSRPVSFAAVGNTGYHCSFHPDMVGTLSVTP